MTETQFFQVCMEVVNMIVDIFSAMMDQWYLRLLFIAGLIWIGFDLFQILSDDDLNDKSK